MISTTNISISNQPLTKDYNKDDINEKSYQTGTITTLSKKIKTINRSIKNIDIDTSNSSISNIGDQRTMDAADTLVSLAHSANTTPTIEFKPFIQTTNTLNQHLSNNQLSNNETETIEKTIKLDEFNSKDVLDNIDNLNDKNSKDIVESACKILLEQVLKSCPNANLSSITIKATAVSSNKTCPVLIDEKNIKDSENNNETIKLKDLDLSKDVDLTNDENKTVISDSMSAKNTSNKVQTKKLRLNAKNNPTYANYDNLDHNNSLCSDSDSDSRLTFNQINNRSAPTLATGRKSKDIELPPDEAKKRQERRERNKEAAARCRRRREDLANSLSKKTEDLNKEQENLKRKFQNLIQEKSRLECLLKEHEKKCNKTLNILNSNQNILYQKSQQEQNLIKIKKEEINEFIKQSQEKKVNQKIQQSEIKSSQSILEKDKANLLNQRFTPSVIITPNSASYNTCIQLENIINQFDQSNKSLCDSLSSTNNKLNINDNHNLNLSSNSDSNVVSLARPNNLNLQSSNIIQASAENSFLATSTATFASSVLKGLAFALGQHAQPQSNSVTINSNNNISLLMTPTLQLNTPLLALTPLEATLSAFTSCSSPIFTQQTPVLSIPTTSLTNPNQTNNSNKKLEVIENNNKNNLINS